jgi:hypothetical protein
VGFLTKIALSAAAVRDLLASERRGA